MTRPWRDAEDAADAGEDEPPDRELCCSVCGQPVTRRAHAIERLGAHEHVFANPGGFVHRVRCFAVAQGLAEVGSPETAFSWFPGWSWQITDCGRCRVHIGWRYRLGAESFWGLVATRLTER